MICLMGRGIFFQWSKREGQSIVLILICLATVYSGDALAGAKGIESGRFSPGVYYMPKPSVFAQQWKDMYAYNYSMGRDEISPLLGMYRGDSTKVIDWQIEMAQKAGIEWFIFDIFFNGLSGVPRYSDGFEAYLGSDKKNMVKFAAMFVNDRSLMPESPSDILIQFESYLKWNSSIISNNSNYLRIDNRPVIVIWRPQILLGAFMGTLQGGGKKKTSDSFEGYLKKVMMKTFGESSESWPLLFSAKMPSTCGEVSALRDMGVAGVIPYVSLLQKDLNKIEARGSKLDYKEYVKLVKFNHENLFSCYNSSGFMSVPSVPVGYSGAATKSSAIEMLGENEVDYKCLLVSVINEAMRRESLVEINGKLMISLGAWNEWLSGNAIEPGKLHGFENPFGRINVISEVFGAKESDWSDRCPDCNQVDMPSEWMSLDLEGKDEIEFYSWLQDAELLPTGLMLSFDRRFRIEFPVSYRFQKYLKVKFVFAKNGASNQPGGFKIKAVATVMTADGPVTLFSEAKVLPNFGGERAIEFSFGDREDVVKGGDVIGIEVWGDAVRNAQGGSNFVINLKRIDLSGGREQ